MKPRLAMDRSRIDRADQRRNAFVLNNRKGGLLIAFAIGTTGAVPTWLGIGSALLGAATLGVVAAVAYVFVSQIVFAWMWIRDPSTELVAQGERVVHLEHRITTLTQRPVTVEHRRDIRACLDTLRKSAQSAHAPPPLHPRCVARLQGHCPEVHGAMAAWYESHPGLMEAGTALVEAVLESAQRLPRRLNYTHYRRRAIEDAAAGVPLALNSRFEIMSTDVAGERRLAWLRPSDNDNGIYLGQLREADVMTAKLAVMSAYQAVTRSPELSRYLDARAEEQVLRSRVVAAVDDALDRVNFGGECPACA